VTLECSVAALPLIADYLPRGLKTPASGHTLTLEVPFAHYGSLTHFCGGRFSHLVRLLSPSSAVHAVTSFGQKALAAYDA